MSIRSSVVRRLGLDDLRDTELSLAPLLVLFGLNAVDELDQAAFGVLSPEIRDHFGLSNTALTVFTIVLVPIVVGASLPVGFLADRLSRKGMAIGGACMWMGFAVLAGLAPVVGAFFVCRGLGALGRSVNGPTHRSLLSDLYPPDSRVGVFSAWRLANPISNFFAPIVAGMLGSALGFRWALILLAIPTVAMVAVAVRYLNDPVRGAHERRAQGADEATALTEETPPTWTEAWRTMGGVATVRRIRRALPFLVGGLIGMALLRAPYYEEVFGTGAAGRGLLAAANEPFQILGLLIGIPVATRLVREAPDRFMGMCALAAVAAAAGFVAIAVAPTIVVAGLATCFVAMALAIVTPGIPAMISLIVPPRIRTFGFGVNDLYALPGLVFPVIAALIADRAGFRWGMLAMVPVFLVGAYLIGTSGGAVRSDIRSAQMAAVAAAEYKRARSEGRAKLLVCRGLEAHYGSVQVLFGVDFDVDDGEVVALLGTNGAGKSTLLKVIAGTGPTTGGNVVFDGRDVTYLGAQQLLSAGVCYMPGGRAIFPGLTVAENLEVARWTRRRDASDASAADGDAALARFPALADRRGEVAGNLSGGQQQMLGLAMALLARPKLLMIDELSLGLAPAIVAQLLDTVREINAAGTTVVLVEQSVNIALALAGRAVFMEKGEVRFEGPARELLERPDLLRSVFLDGASAALDAAPPPAPPPDGPPPAAVRRPFGLTASIRRRPVLAGHDLSISFGGVSALYEVSLAVAEAEIVGLIGPNGAGKTTLLDVLAGHLRPSSGTIRLAGREVTRLRADQRAGLGLGRSFQDARLFPSLTVSETLAVAFHRHLGRRGALAAVLRFPDQRAEERQLVGRVDELLELLGLERHRDAFVSDLSTGTRRIVDLGCALAVAPSVLLLDEPSSGIAQREAESLGPLLADIRDRTRTALVIVEHDMPLVSGVADRLVALDLGQVIAEGRPPDVLADPVVVSSYLGDDRSAVSRSGRPEPVA
jgi:branched-chain amino acid transport system ATP-binding protein